jgi:hypothetical protein
MNQIKARPAGPSKRSAASAAARPEERQDVLQDAASTDDDEHPRGERQRDGPAGHEIAVPVRVHRWVTR